MQRGFSLLELSIVLVIIGLITGGIMAGQSMVHAAEIRSLISDVRKYQSAVNTFREKYNALPGDMKNAVKYWGTQAGASTDGYDATCAALTTAATGTATCNGDGSGSVSTVSGSYYEMFRFWQHLANAGLIEGQYSGVPNGTSLFDHNIGVNCPSSKISGVGYTVRTWGSLTGDTYRFDGNYGNSFEIGTATTGTTSNRPFLTPADMMGIDQKIDDGQPAYGGLLAFKSTWNNGCTSSDTASSSAYSATNAAKTCSLIFTNQF